MLATLQLLLALGLGREAVVADLVGTAVAVAVVFLAVSPRRARPASQDEVVAEAEGVVRDAGQRQPV